MTGEHVVPVIFQDKKFSYLAGIFEQDNKILLSFNLNRIL